MKTPPLPRSHLNGSRVMFASQRIKMKWLLGGLAKSLSFPVETAAPSVEPLSGSFLLLLEEQKADHDAENKPQDGTEHDEEELGPRHGRWWVVHVISWGCKK